MGYFTSYQLGAFVFCDISPTVCTPSDGGHRIISKELNIADCGAGGCNWTVINNGTLLCSLSQSWNCNLCGNDRPYYIPLDTNDTFFAQFQQLDSFNGVGQLAGSDPNYGQYGWGTLLNGYIKNCCDDRYIESSPGVKKSIADYIYAGHSLIGQYFWKDFIGTMNYKNIQEFEFDASLIYADLMAQLNSDCFYIEWEFNESSGNQYTIYSEPYKFVNCKHTLMISGDYGKTDCNGYYYSQKNIQYNTSISAPFNYSNEMRFPAYIERTGFSIEKTYVGTKLNATSSSMIEKFKLTTDRIPEKIAMYLANLLASETVWIDGESYVIDGEINKNNDVGSQWFIEAELRKKNCNKSFGNCN